MRPGPRRSGVPLAAAVAALGVAPAAASAEAWPAIDTAANTAANATTRLAAEAAADERLRARLSSRWVGAGGRSSAYVRDVRGGTGIYASAPDAGRVPASITKLFTVTAALREAGPGFAAATEVRTTGERDGDRWVGSIYLSGGGDGTLDRARLRQIARSLKDRLGVRRITGRVVADDSALDRRRGSARTGGRYDSDMGGVLGALTVSGGFAGGRDPAVRAASLLRAELADARVAVDGAVARGRTPRSAVTQVLAPAPALSSLAGSILRPSDNFLSELLVKQLDTGAGRQARCEQDARADLAVTEATAEDDEDVPGTAACVREPAPPASTAAGLGVVRSSLRDLRLSPTLRDGSGLSRASRVTARQVVGIASAAATDPALAPVLTKAMPVAGRTGTLRRRMRGTAAQGRCYGKTGTLRGVSTLGGWCRTAGGRTLAFALLQDGVDVGGARARQDRFLATLAADASPAAR